MKDQASGIDQEQDWDIEVSSKSTVGRILPADLWKYKDLLFLFVKRDLVTTYKQTILGPLWFLIQPVLTSIAFTIIFGRLAGIPTGGLPPLLFYLCGVTSWTYFSDFALRTSNTFVANAGIFSKVYFPRIIVPLSVVISSLAKFGVQLLLLTGVIIWYQFHGIEINSFGGLLFLPMLIVLMAGLGLSVGMLISSLTTRFRDLQFLVGFGIQLLMYLTPVVYPLSMVAPGSKMEFLIKLNPMTAVVETVRYSFLGGEFIGWASLAYSAGFMLVSLLLALWVFNRAQRTFMDTV